MKGTDSLLFELNAQGVALITLNRPHVHNAIDPDMLDGLLNMLRMAAADDAVRAVILTGAGDQSFSAGADIRYLQHASSLQVRDFARQAVRVTEHIEALGKPVIAALNGDARGGGLELAEACMLRIATSGARLGHPEVRIGAVAGFGGTTRLARLVGKGRAAAMLLTGQCIDADEALAIGLVHAVVPREALMSEAQGWLDQVLVHSPDAVRLTWEALHRGLDLPLSESAALGADHFGLVATTLGFRQGTRGFVERRGA